MARKRKRKKKRRAEAVEARSSVADEASTDEGDTGAGPHDTEQGVGDTAAAATPAPTDDPDDDPVDEVVEDLDAVLDDDVEDLDALIAATAAGGGAPIEILDEDEVVLIDLDAEERDGPLDQEAGQEQGVFAEAVAAEAEPATDEGATMAASASPDDASAVRTLGTTATGEDVGDDDLVDLDADVPPEGRIPTVTVAPVPEDDAYDPEAIDLGPGSSPDEVERLVAATLAHAEYQDARYRVPYSDERRASRWKALAATVLLLVAMTVALAPPPPVRPPALPSVTDSDRALGVRMVLLLQARQVDAFHTRYQRLPASLDEVVHAEGIRYARQGNRAYQLLAYEPDGTAVVYDSASPTPAFGSLAARLRAEGAP